MTDFDISKIQTQTIQLRNGIEVDVRRLDKMDDLIQGNKYFKLKPNIEQMRLEGKETMVTCGGVWSNHIAATAAAGKRFGFKTVGLIRGYEERPRTQTLIEAEENGMDIRFVDREVYARREDHQQFLSELSIPESCYYVPEGGSNVLGIRGASQMYFEEDHRYEYILIAAGTGTSASGIFLRLQAHQKLLVVPVLKGAELFASTIVSLLQRMNEVIDPSKIDRQLEILYPFHFGGYGKWNAAIEEIISHYDALHLPLDQVYTAKAMAAAEHFTTGLQQKSRLLIIHTGGLQGRRSINGF